MIAATSLVAIVAIALLAGRLGSLALISTGLPAEIARFQARSALTGVGYTTTEAESLVGHPVRRRIVMALMLAGNVGLVTVAGSIMISFANSGNTADAFSRLAIMIVGVVVVFWLMHRPRVESMITSLLTRALNRFSDLELRDYHHLMRLSSDYAVTELAVQADDWLADESLASLDLPDEGVLALAVQRANGDFIGAPRGDCVLHVGDTVYLYGRSDILDRLDHRQNTPEGQAEHDRTVREHRDQQRRQRMRSRLQPRRSRRSTTAPADDPKSPSDH